MTKDATVQSEVKVEKIQKKAWEQPKLALLDMEETNMFTGSGADGGSNTMM